MNDSHGFPSRCIRWLLCIVASIGLVVPCAFGAVSDALEVGLAVRDITPELPIWLAGYAARNRPADKIDQPLLVQALALKNPTGERFVFVALDNCEVSHAFIAPVLRELEQKHQLKRGAVMVVSSHTHSAPVLDNTLDGMFELPDVERARIHKYSETLRGRLAEVVAAALADFQPARLEQGAGRATFAMNRRVYQDDKVVFGENPDGPVDWQVSVLKVSGTNGTVRAVIFGYGCHGTSLSGDDFYTVSGDYMGYARQQIQSVYPGVTAIYLTGMGADSNPSPRGRLLDARRHGLELAGAVAGVLDRPMRPVRGQMKFAYDEADLPLVDSPNREQIEKDARNNDLYVRNRAAASLKLLDQGKPLPSSVPLPLAAVRIGNDLTLVAMGGEVVVDYGIRFKRLFAADHPWLIGYAYEVPCYIPSARIIKEGGYEAQSSLIYYGLYGPFSTRVEKILVDKMAELVKRLEDPSP
jgi:neutral ceramidase